MRKDIIGKKKPTQGKFLVPMMMENSLLIFAFKGVGAEVVAETLDKVCGELFGGDCQEVVESGKKAGGGNVFFEKFCREVFEIGKGCRHNGFGLVGKQEMFDGWLFFIDMGEGTEEVRADDAPALPDAADFAEVDGPDPAFFVRSGTGKAGFLRPRALRSEGAR